MCKIPEDAIINPSLEIGEGAESSESLDIANVEVSAESIRLLVEEKVRLESESHRRKKKRPVALKMRLRRLIQLVHAGERGDASILIKLGKGRYIYDHSDKNWYLFADHSYKLDKTGIVFNLIEQYSNLLLVEAEATKELRDRPGFDKKKFDKAFIAKSKKLEDLNYGKRILEYSAQGRCGLGIDGSEWDANPQLLGFKNGVLDLSTFEFRPGMAKDYIREIIPFDWLGMNTPAPAWEKFLNDTLPEDIQDQAKGGAVEVICYLQKLLGCAISGQVKERVLPILIGAGQNGKGTLLEALAKILGPLACPVDPEMIMDQLFSRSSSAPSADKMALRSKRLVWASESNEGRKIDSGKVKALTGGDSITARAPYAKFQVTFLPTHQLFLVTNHAPEVDPDDNAMWYRLRLIPFQVSFVEQPKATYERAKDTGLMDKLVAEASGVVAWMVRGYKAYLDTGLVPPDRVLLATQDYRSESDLISQFVAECLVKDSSSKIPASKLYTTYIKWVEALKVKPLAMNKFGTKIGAKIGKSCRSAGSNVYIGYRLSK